MFAIESQRHSDVDFGRRRFSLFNQDEVRGWVKEAASGPSLTDSVLACTAGRACFRSNERFSERDTAMATVYTCSIRSTSVTRLPLSRPGTCYPALPMSGIGDASSIAYQPSRDLGVLEAAYSLSSHRSKIISPRWNLTVTSNFRLH